MAKVRLELVSPSGDSFDLISPNRRYAVAFIEGETIEGLVGSFEDSAELVPGVPGAVFRPEDRAVHPLAGSFTAVLADADAYGRFFAAWSTRVPSALRLTIDDSLFVLPARLAAALPWPSSRIRLGSRIPVSVVADGGVWLHPQEGDGEVTIMNFGDVDIAPTIRWEGDGGTMVLESGARLQLPPTKQPRFISMDSQTASMVHGPGGTVDEELTATVAPFGELIPPGQSATILVPEGATVIWNVGVLSPW